MTVNRSPISKLSAESAFQASVARRLGLAVLEGAINSFPRPEPPTAYLEMPARSEGSRASAIRGLELRQDRVPIRRDTERVCRLQEGRRVAEPGRQDYRISESLPLNVTPPPVSPSPGDRSWTGRALSEPRSPGFFPA
jgi:hypothetical protein